MLAYAAYNLVSALLAWPLGRLSDRIGRTRLLAVGFVVFGLVYGAVASATGAALLIASVGTGLLWSQVGHAAPFLAGAASATAALAGLVVARFRSS